MKNVLILHGTDGSPDVNWFPWLKKELEAEGYNVCVPLLPENHTPNAQIYNDYVFSLEFDLDQAIVVGHSSGAVSVLNLLMDERCPIIKMGIMVGAWSETEDTPLDIDQFADLFPINGFDFELIEDKSERLIFVHGSDDPFCPIDQARWLADRLHADFVEVPSGGHLGKDFKELPLLLTLLPIQD